MAAEDGLGVSIASETRRGVEETPCKRRRAAWWARLAPRGGLSGGEGWTLLSWLAPSRGLVVLRAMRLAASLDHEAGLVVGWFQFLSKSKARRYCLLRKLHVFHLHASLLQ